MKLAFLKTSLFICVLAMLATCGSNVYDPPAFAATPAGIKKPAVNTDKQKQQQAKKGANLKMPPSANTKHKGLADKYVPLEEAVGLHDSALLVAPDGRQLYAKNTNLARVPASTIKVLTVANAIYYLGAEYHFKTEVYLTPDRSLKIRGMGDPMLTSEVVQQLVQELLPHLPYKTFRNLELDDTFFEDGTFIVSGIENNLHKLYNAACGALSVNFNVVQFKIKDGTYTNLDKYTPMTPLSFRRALATNQKAGSFVLWYENFEPTWYAGEIFKYFLEEAGVSFTGEIVRKPKSQQDVLLLQFKSPHTLVDVSRALLKHSNNFIANQISMTVAAEVTGQPASMDRALKLTQDYLHNINLYDVKLVEASGLSRDNAITANDMYQILQNFDTYKDLLRNENGHLYKTGTLKDVRARVGFIETPKGNYAFVILMNTLGKSALPVLDNFFEMAYKDAGLE